MCAAFLAVVPAVKTSSVKAGLAYVSVIPFASLAAPNESVDIISGETAPGDAAESRRMTSFFPSDCAPEVLAEKPLEDAVCVFPFASLSSVINIRGLLLYIVFSAVGAFIVGAIGTELRRTADVAFSNAATSPPFNFQMASLLLADCASLDARHYPQSISRRN